MQKMIIFTFTLVLALASNVLSQEEINAEPYKGEHIIYTMSPSGGRAEYNDLGIVDLDGKKAKLVTLSIRALKFKDTETVYSDPLTSLPIRVERDVKWFTREKIIEEYDQEKFTITVKKFKRKKQTSEKIIQCDGPIQNAILLPINMRNMPEPEIGWTFDVRLPEKFEVKLVSIDEVKIRGKKVSAYHFTANPDKFEIWISKDAPRVPVKAIGKDKYRYTMRLKKYELPKRN